MERHLRNCRRSPRIPLVTSTIPIKYEGNIAGRQVKCLRKRNDFSKRDGAVESAADMSVLHGGPSRSDQKAVHHI